MRPRVSHSITKAMESPSETQPPPAPASPHVFSRARHVHVDGANTFSNAGGSIFHINHVTVLDTRNDIVSATGNLGLALSSPIDRTQTLQQVPSPRQDATSRMTVVTRPSHLAQSPSKPPHEGEVYARLLYTKGHGYPLFDPQLRSNLPAEYLERGISIGDVGIITAEGKFDFLFNICLPADHPINGGIVPDGFRPICINESRDMDINPRGWKPGTYIVGGSVKAVYSSLTSQFDGKYTFECSSGNGAILVLPEGGVRADLLSLGDFFKCAEKNAHHWYRFVNRIRGRQAVNGSLYLVTGYDKTGAWGTASFSDVDGSRMFDLTFSASHSTAQQDPSSVYAWSASYSATTKEGSVFNLTDDLRKRPQIQNQCVFLRGYRITLGETFWNLLFHTVDVEEIKGQPPARLFRRSTFVPFGPNEALWGKLLNLFSDRGLSIS